MPDLRRLLVGYAPTRRLRIGWVGAALLFLGGAWPLVAFLAQPGVSWENETVEDFGAGRISQPSRVIANEGFLPNARGLYLAPGTKGRFTYRVGKPAGRPLLLQAWIYGRAPAVTSSLSIADDSGTFALILPDVYLTGDLIRLPSSLDDASAVNIDLQATNASISNELILDQIIVGVGRGTAPTQAPLWSYWFIAAGIGMGVLTCLRGRGAVAIALAIAVLTGTTLFTRFEALDHHSLEPLDPDAIGYRVYADRFQWWPPWESGVFSGEFAEREPFYPLVVRAYFDLLGSSDFHLRVVSSSLAVLAVGLTLVAARRRLDWPLALGVTAVVAVNQPLINESYRGLRTELEFCILLGLYLALDREGPPRKSADALIAGVLGTLLVLTRSFYLPVALALIGLASLARHRTARAVATSVLISATVILVPVVGHRAALAMQQGDPLNDTAGYARWLANVEVFVQGRTLPHPELFPSQSDYARYGPYFGPHISYAQYLLQIHSLPEFITESAHGYVDIFRNLAVFSPLPASGEQTTLGRLSALVDVLLKCVATLGLAMLGASAVRRRRLLDLLLPALVVGVLSFSAFLYHLGLIEEQRNTIQVLPFVLVAAGTAVETVLRRFSLGWLATWLQRGVSTLRSAMTEATQDERLAIFTGLVSGAVGAGLVNFISLSIEGPAGIFATLVAGALAVGAALWRPLWAAWLLVVAVLFPIHLVPFTFTTVVVVATYAGIAWRVATGRGRARVGSAGLATGVLAVAIFSAAAGSVLAGNAVAPDGGLRLAAAFIFLMGIAFSLPHLVGRNARSTISFIVALAVGMSIWGLIEYFGRSGLLPIAPEAWANDQLPKAFPGAVSSAFVGGGPNTYATFLGVALALAGVGLKERVLAPLAALAAVTLSLNLAFTYSRGGELAGLAGLLWLLIRWRPGTRRRVMAVVVLLVGSIALSYLVGFSRTGAPILAATRGDTWRSFVADPSSAIVQELEVPSGTVPDKLFIKLRAAPGDGYQVQVSVNERVVFLGKSQLPSSELQWIEIPLPPDLLANTTLAIVECRLVGQGDQHDRYFEVEGTTKPMAGAHSRFSHGASVQDTDLSLDPGVQSGSYLIQFGTQQPGPEEPAKLPTGTIAESIANAAASTIQADDRLALWNVALHSFETHPLFGIGFYSSSIVLRGQFTTIDYANFHNEFLEFLAGSGLLGLLGLVVFFLILGRTLWRASRRPPGWDEHLALPLEAAMVALGVAFIFGSFLVDSRIAGLTWVLAGLVGTYDVRDLGWPQTASLSP